MLIDYLSKQDAGRLILFLNWMWSYFEIINTSSSYKFLILMCLVFILHLETRPIAKNFVFYLGCVFLNHVMVFGSLVFLLLSVHSAFVKLSLFVIVYRFLYWLSLYGFLHLSLSLSLSLSHTQVFIFTLKWILPNAL